MKLLYCSGAMSAFGVAGGWNFAAFREASRQLRKAGFAVLDPSEKGIVTDWTWADYLRHDLKQVLMAEGVALLSVDHLDPKHQHYSKGAELECHVARALGMPVRSVEEWLT